MKLMIASSIMVLTLGGCGGGGGGGSTTSLTGSDVYPAGVAVSSPSSLTSSSDPVTASLNLPWQRRLGDWWNHLLQAAEQGNANEFARALNPLLPISTAQAAPAKVLEGPNVANYVQKVLDGTATPTAETLPIDGFFKSYNAANCYGPQVLYALHDDSTTTPKQSGNLPGGDVGMWLDRDGDQTTGTPCAAAQLGQLMEPIKSRANSSLILGARMVQVALAGTGMPATSTSSDVATGFQTLIDSLMPIGATANVTLAGITNNGSNSYTYQWRVGFTSGADVGWLVVNLTHTKTSSGFEGLLQYGSSQLDTNTQATSQCDATKKLATVGTLRYVKNSASALEFSAREAPYCISTANDMTTTFSSWVSLDSNSELDPTKKTNSVATGWHQDGGGFKRFAANFDPSTGAGDYLFAWQAGIDDSHSRMFAVNTTYNSSSEARALKAFFGFAPNMSTTTNAGHLGELICNWAGPGATHSPVHNLFQSQTLSLPSTAFDWNFPTNVDTDSKIRFVPTNSCSATDTTMTYDVDAGSTTGGTLGATEGAGTAHSLDGLTGGRTTVYDEITSRGFNLPSMY